MYLNLIQIAESFGVTEKVVEDWIRNEGLPHTPDRGRLLFDRSQVANWAATRGLAAHVGFLAPEAPRIGAGWRLEPLLRAGGIHRDIPGSGVTEAFQKIVGSLCGATPSIRQLLAQRLKTSDSITFAPVGGGFALPHPSTRITLGHDSGVVAILFLRDALRLAEKTPDKAPITRLLFFIAPSPRAHLDLLGRLSRLLARGPLRELLVRAAPDNEIFDAVSLADATSPGAGDKEANS